MVYHFESVYSHVSSVASSGGRNFVTGAVVSTSHATFLLSQLAHDSILCEHDLSDILSIFTMRVVLSKLRTPSFVDPLAVTPPVFPIPVVTVIVVFLPGCDFAFEFMLW